MDLFFVNTYINIEPIRMGNYPPPLPKQIGLLTFTAENNFPQDVRFYKLIIFCIKALKYFF